MKFMTWTLHKPSDSNFVNYYDLQSGEPWYSNKWVIKNKNAPESWDYRKTSFLRMIEKYHGEKIYAIGLHEFGVLGNGRIVSTTVSSDTQTDYVLSDDKASIVRPFAKSLRYLMHTYPDIKWSLQFLCTQERVKDVLNFKYNQDTFIDECYKITKLYKDKGYPIKGIEIDFEYTWYGSGETEANAYRDLLSRIKNECCLPLGVELRINLFAMTGKFEPSWYAWHDYETLASAKDKNGNQAVDEFQMMSYDFSWGGSAPGSSTPLWWLEKILKHVKNVLPPHKTYIGNAGYGRRWTLGEWQKDSNGNNTDSLRMGTTLDYKQLMMVQNGMYVHNQGSTSSDGNFYFNNQDFIPICGFNDKESDYVTTYLNVYDKFKMTPSGGADVNEMDKQAGEFSYVTKYSRKQRAIFGGVSEIVNAPTSLNGVIDKKGDYWINNHAVNNSVYATGVGTHSFTGYAITSVPDETTNENDYPKLTYKIDSSGSKRIVALVSFPFYDKETMTMNINGVPKTVNIKHEWYPQTMVQTPHFCDLGICSLDGTGTVEIEYTKGVQIFGFIICDSFDMNLTGGKVNLPTSTKPFKKRGSSVDGVSDIVDAQFPSNFRVVGELIRRPPRPAIIWEDVFGSYEATDGIKTLDITSGYRYYRKDVDGGYSKGTWSAYVPTANEYAHAYCNASGSYGQIVLDNKFSTSLVCDVELRGVETYSTYGIRITESLGQSNDGHIAMIDYRNSAIKIVKETGGVMTTLKSVAMSDSFKTLYNSRIKLKVFILDNKVTLAVNDYVYIQEYPITMGSAKSVGVYLKDSSVKLYKYNISSLERWEAMEKIETIIDGQTYSFGEVPRTVSKDEYGYYVFKGYPYEVMSSFPTNNITSVQVNPNYVWSNDYLNMPLCTCTSWNGEKTVTVNSVDAGIWYKSFYVGDSEGMSVAYNSDITGFIKTVNAINEYQCKGIAMWTLGQEDTRIYSYL